MPEVLPWQSSLLARALELRQSGRLPHAVLLESKSAHDLTGFLLHLAMGLLCENLHGSESCGQCRSCDEFSSGVHSDFRLITIEYNEKTKNSKTTIVNNLVHSHFNVSVSFFTSFHTPHL